MPIHKCVTLAADYCTLKHHDNFEQRPSLQRGEELFGDVDDLLEVSEEGVHVDSAALEQLGGVEAERLPRQLEVAAELTLGLHQLADHVLPLLTVLLSEMSKITLLKLKLK